MRRRSAESPVLSRGVAQCRCRKRPIPVQSQASSVPVKSVIGAPKEALCLLAVQSSILEVDDGLDNERVWCFRGRGDVKEETKNEDD